MVLWQALVLGALQGVAELFPVSSLAQTIIIPALLKWHLSTGKDDQDYLAFVVALHLATAVALVLYFWQDWIKVVRGFVGLGKRGEMKFAWLLVAGTAVVGVAGLAGEKKIRELFEDPRKAWVVAAILVVNGFVMLLGDYVKHRAALAHPGTDAEHVPDEPQPPSDLSVSNALSGGPLVTPPVVSAGGVVAYPTFGARLKRAEDLSFVQATAVGAAQVLALLPGISRSGVTIIGGLWAGLPYEQASRFSFMLATPVILAAALLKVPKLLHEPRAIQIMCLEGSGVAFVTAFLSVAFLMRYFHTNRLWPFGAFCIAFGGFAAYWLKIHG
jgi:undecaprenyl-diphosphatase